jgi:CRP/FNR family transcriptional regulator, cyclic AMP receptor protein
MELSSALRRSLIFKTLSESELQLLAASGKSRRLEAGVDLFAQGDPCEVIMVITLGRVRLWQLTSDGHVMVLRICHPGEILGQMSALDDSAHSVGATTEEEVEIFEIRSHHFRAQLEKEPPRALLLARLLAQRVRELSLELEAMKFSTIGERLLGQLRSLAQGRREVRVTHQMLADRVGATRENVSRVLGLLREQGILELKRGSIQILDHERLLHWRVERPMGG